MNPLLAKALRDVGFDVPPRPHDQGFLVASTLGGALIVHEPSPGTFLLETRDGGVIYQSSDRVAIAEWAKSVRAGTEVKPVADNLSSVKEALQKRLKAYAESGTEATSETKRRIGQDVWREALMVRYERRCPFSGVRDERLLRASHIKPWADSNDEERLDPDNGFLMNVMLDALFDKGMVRVNEQGQLIPAEALDESVQLQVDAAKAVNLTPGNLHYLKLLS